jgi:hypothetical protein
MAILLPNDPLVIGVIVVVISLYLEYKTSYFRENKPVEPSPIGSSVIITSETPPINASSSKAIPYVTAPTNTTEPSVTSPPTISPTPTKTALAIRPPNTPNPKPTSTTTPTSTPAPPGTDLINDNFDNGWSSAWTVWQGDPAVSNKQLTAYHSAWMIVGDPAWRNYKVEFDVAEVGNFYNYIQVGIRMEDDEILKNLFVAEFGKDYCFWWVRSNRISDEVPATRRGIGLNNLKHITIIADNNNFSIFSYADEITSFHDDKYPYGRVALYVVNGILIDNFKITSLP